MCRVMLLGFGNPLCGDDGIGWHAAGILAPEYGEGPVSVLACRQLTPDLADLVGRAGRVVFVDASVDDPPGCIRTRPVRPAGLRPNCFTHEISPEALLTWTRELYGSTPEATLVTVGARNMEIGSALSSEVETAVPALLALLRRECGGATNP